MIELKQGNILSARADVLVNTVNCVGVMGRGIALQFAKAFPDMLKAYESLCKQEQLKPGTVHVYDLNRFQPPHYVINFPTKRHWRDKSRIEDIDAGLQALVHALRRLGIRSVAVPPLGCGLGGLDWNDVRPRIEQAFASLPGVQVLLFEPRGAPSPEEMARTDKTPRMTDGRASLLGLMRRYLAAVLDPWISLLEIHKLMYFMQESGQALNLTFRKGTYGPYAENLRHVLKCIEGHFVVGYGDAADEPDKPIYLKPEALQQAEEFLADHPDVHKRFDRVAKLIDGFETPFGMELLSTVHWVVTRENAKSPEQAIAATYGWNERKRMFSEEHVRIAWKTLQQNQWFTSAKAGDQPRLAR
jgi:O-acetyl-ADP-ribose deacetylase (regulator of RNase III)